MKKVLVVLAVLVALSVAAAAVFIATFDLNRYRPLILKQIRAVTGKEAAIGRLSLAWKDGLAARLDHLSLYDKGDETPDASVENVLVRLQVAPLLRKEVRISSVWISGPKLIIERFADGTVSVAGIRPPASGSPGSSTFPEKASATDAGSAAAAVAFSVDAIRIENAEIRLIDNTPSAALDLTLADLDADFKNVALDKPLSFAARAAIGGASQNVALGGRVTAPRGNEPALLEHFTLQMDLGAIDLAKLAQSLPSLRAAGLQKAGGMLEAKIERLVLDPAELARAQAQVTLKNGSLTLASVPLPLENVALEASLKAGNAEIKNLSADFAGGSLHIQGTVKDLTGRADSAFRASVRDLSVGKLAKVASPRAPRLEGKLALDFEGRGRGLDAAGLQSTLTGQGRLALKDGVLVNSNLLRTVVEKISQIPGVGERAISRIPPQYLSKINEPSTILRPFEMPFAVQQGRVFFDQMNIPTELFVMAGRGSIGFDRSLAIQAGILFDGGFSQALAAVAPPVLYLTNAARQIEIQATIQGVPPDVAIKPNLDAAIQRVGQQVVTDLLQKKDPKDILSGLLSGGQQPAAAAQAAPTAQTGGIPVEPAVGEPQAEQQPQSTEDQLLGLLSGALNKNKQQ